MKPRVLELGCGAGGMSRCLLAAGFHVVGVDLVDRPERPREVEFIQADWTTVPPGGFGQFDAAWASPPCTGFSTARPDKVNRPNELDWNTARTAWAHILEAAGPGNPWVMENVAGAVNFFKPWIGKPFLKTRGHYFWGMCPDLGIMPRSNMPGKGWNQKTRNGLYKPPNGDAHLRAMIKPEIGLPIAHAMMEGVRYRQAREARPVCILGQSNLAEQREDS